MKRKINKPFIEKQDIFTAKTHGYHTYRIPTLVVTQKGTILAFAEARISTSSDWAGISIVMKRSIDHGKSWEPIKVIASSENKPTHNLVAIVPIDSNKIHFLYCYDYKRVFYIKSQDDGKTFSKPTEITHFFEEFKTEFKFRIIGTGPGKGIQLNTGRLVVPIWLARRHIHRPSVASIIYSDDDAKSWHRSEIILGSLVNAGETNVVQLEDGSVLLNIRNEAPISRRAVSISKDGGIHWSEPIFDDALLEPVCFASIVRLTSSKTEKKNRILFVNPDSIEGEPRVFNMRPRKNLTIKLSYDECETWPISKTLESGSSGYADLAIGNDYSIFCLYENDCPIENDFYTAAITLARFNLEWLTDNKDNIAL